MGFNIDTAPLWSQYRSQFPVTENLIYLNHAAVAPLSKAASDALRDFADDACRFGSLHYADWLATYDGVRQAAAQLTGSRPDEIALVKNTSEGIATIAMGIDWRAGDKIVVFTEEFPANCYPWQRLESKDVLLEWLPVDAPLEQIDAACQDARLLAISFVQYLGGRRADLNAIGEICHRRGVIFFVDAIQGLGAFPLDVGAAHIDAFSADGHKWLLGPEGCGILYISKELQERVEPVEFGWTNVAGYADYASRDMSLRADAGRYECGTLNTIGCYGLLASMKLLLSIGVDRIAPAIQALGDQIAGGVTEKGYEILAHRTPATGAGIVSFRKPNLDSVAIVQELRQKDIIASPRQGWVRTSPHFYISPEDIDRMLEALP
jgi:selenocysteine lyase/cysteine desulfurase